MNEQRLRRISPRALEAPNSIETMADQESMDSAESEEPKKYYRTVPGFPNVMVEFDEPEPERKTRGEPKLWATLLLAGGVLLMLTETTTLASVLYN
eukprot:CAMPEP_0117673004 /NCGR_PEP_ID=MMETSP0804-20121206/14232_1 /TAXON_ID=1074897 /ORGANISM="Tetraselmis astigmatica, Strain CCMP880" /LENGTH=95 /DNA_ID=CAMNT_0005481695 /DNA_START=190 /DNA_END=477 /DNA_ORIENTATION=+